MRAYLKRAGIISRLVSRAKKRAFLWMAAQKDKPADEMCGHEEDSIWFTDQYRKKPTIDMAKAVSIILGVVFLAIFTDR